MSNKTQWKITANSQLRVLSNAGIEEIAIVTGYKRDY